MSNNHSTPTQSGAAVKALSLRVLQLLKEHKRVSLLLEQSSAELRREQALTRELQQKLQQSQADISRLELLQGLAGGANKRGGDKRGGDKGGADKVGKENGGNGESAAQHKRAKARVNKLLREIDRCIALLK